MEDEECVEEACGGEDALEGGERVAIENGDEASWEVDDIVDCCRAANCDVYAAGACIRLRSQLSNKRLTLVKDLAVDILEFAHARTDARISCVESPSGNLNARANYKTDKYQRYAPSTALTIPKTDFSFNIMYRLSSDSSP